jgi:hypothetical protein
MTAMTKARSNLPLRIAGLAAGFLLAASLLYVLRFPPSDGSLGADVQLVALAPGELTVKPTDAFLAGRDLKPGGPAAEGELRVRNITTGPLDVRVNALPSDRALARLVHIRLSSGGRVLADSNIAAIRHGSDPMRIPLGRAGTLRAKVWIPRSVKRGYQARLAQVTMDLRAHVIKGRR